MAMVHVLAFITAKPGMRDAVLEAFRANVPAVHAEDGCIEYGAATDTPDAGSRTCSRSAPSTSCPAPEPERTRPRRREFVSGSGRCGLPGPSAAWARPSSERGCVHRGSPRHVPGPPPLHDP
jgi:hypothetical protein